VRCRCICLRRSPTRDLGSIRARSADIAPRICLRDEGALCGRMGRVLVLQCCTHFEACVACCLRDDNRDFVAHMIASGAESQVSPPRPAPPRVHTRPAPPRPAPPRPAPTSAKPCTPAVLSARGLAFGT
jgi:hypothetical protein